MFSVCVSDVLVSVLVFQVPNPGIDSSVMFVCTKRYAYRCKMEKFLVYYSVIIYFNKGLFCKLTW